MRPRWPPASPPVSSSGPQRPERWRRLAPHCWRLARPPDVWQRMQRNAMAADVSWRRSAQPYVALYRILGGGPRRETDRPGGGSPDTLGVTVVGGGIDVAVHAPDADAVAICLFDASDREIDRPRSPGRAPGRCFTATSPTCRSARATDCGPTGRWDPGQRPPVQPVQAADRPLGDGDRPAVPAASAVVRSRRPAPRRHRRADAESDRRRTGVRSHRVPATAPRSTGTARSSTNCMSAASP